MVKQKISRLDIWRIFVQFFEDPTDLRVGMVNTIVEYLIEPESHNSR